MMTDGRVPGRPTQFIKGEGRPSKYTPERVQRILDALKVGATRAAAARAGGIDQWTLRKWMKEREGFGDQVEEAESAAELKHTAIVMKAAQNGNVRASMFWLERRRPVDYGRVDRVEVLVRRQRAEDLARELALEGIDVTPDELEAEYNALATKTASAPRMLPPPADPVEPVADLPAFDTFDV